MFLIQGGWLKRVMPAPSGRLSVIDLHTTGDLIGEASYAGRVRCDSAVAMSPCVVRVITLDQLLDLVRDHNLLHRWMLFLSARLRMQQQIIYQFATLDCQRRLGARLLMLAIQIGAPDEQLVSLPRRITQEELGAMVGTTRSRVGQFLHDFENRGLIRRIDQAIVIFPAPLTAYIESHE